MQHLTDHKPNLDMKKTFIAATLAAIAFTVACGPKGPTPEELAAQEKARQDSIATVQLAREDSIKAALQAEATAKAAAAYTAGANAANKANATKPEESKPAASTPAKTGNPILDKANAAQQPAKNPIDAKQQKAQEQKASPVNPIDAKKQKAKQ